MLEKRRVCVITGTRAEYGLLYWLMKEIEATDSLELQIIVTGMHLSPEFGLTYQQIEQDGFTISEKVEMLLSSDTSIGIAKSMGLGVIGFADSFASLKPDLIVVLGDRFEMFSAVSAATLTRIPVAHIHGGERTEGSFDEALRHSITKMSHLHFTATDEYRSRVIQMGEHPDRVFNYGALGVDNIFRTSLLSREKFEEAIDFKLGKCNLLVTFHPVTLEKSTSATQFNNLLKVLEEKKNYHVIFTKANADPEGRMINKMIDDFTSLHSGRMISHTSLGQLKYLSAMRHVDAVVGNSSSGIIEAPSFNIGTINIGDRQKGRIQAKSVIDCAPTLQGIRHALSKLDSEKFQKNLKETINPYGSGNCATKIMKQLCKVNLDKLLRKEFFDSIAN